MKYPTLVTAAIIGKDGKFLLTQRPKEKNNGGRWEFPGGKVEFGEDPRHCLKREIEEELGITIEVGNLFEYTSHVYHGEQHIVLLAFLCDYELGEIEKHDIVDYAWVTPSEMDNYDITEADILFVEKLKSR